ncbi:hypothetical protein MLD38_016383 [Melastoma candidum]|uniref:Uncharacterized protein n=1 Tax=Melastoma candidum TaxID=119954 RepID=A0ACB9RJA1_9MYRT|nr:hypothetical protein MLD38_016383 [Melastoma candidum]
MTTKKRMVNISATTLLLRDDDVEAALAFFKALIRSILARFNEADSDISWISMRSEALSDGPLGGRGGFEGFLLFTLCFLSLKSSALHYRQFVLPPIHLSSQFPKLPPDLA